MEFFAPIAIVGQGCVLPGALSPEQLWFAVLAGEDILADAPNDYWGVDPEHVATTAEDAAIDCTWSRRGGYVRGFDESFDAGGFLLDEEFIKGLDPLFKWTLDAARQAWRDAGNSIQADRTWRGGVILGNLSYPTRALADFAESVWRGEDLQVDPHNRYMSGLPAHLIARAVGMSGGSFSLDAACASSLYAIKIACDRLHEGSADIMLAGGVNHADDLFLHVGFCALNAMSKTGQSRPFNQGADGLVPAEGAGFVVLKRLEDALRDGDAIAGVIRGVGLSNDGRGRGMLTPSEQGQWLAMQRAYAMSGLTPADISLVECHATGTPLGDATELRSMARVFEGVADVPIGSIKSNMGHPITASGVAGLLKMLAAMKHETRPATLHVDDPIDWLGETPFRPIVSAEPWEAKGLRRAAINNFGFGGNNAHLLVEEWVGQKITPPESASIKSSQIEDETPIAIVGISVIAGECEGVLVFERALLDEPDAAFVRRVEEIDFDVKKLRFPPNDLKHTLGQQLLALKAGLLIEQQIDALDGERTGIYMGMQCDTEIARYGARWRMIERTGDTPDLEKSRDSVAPGLLAAGVLGTMPNIVANRLNSQFNLSGPSYTVSSEEASGVVALELAARALRHGELDAALVGAVDLCVDPVHETAAKHVLPEDRQVQGDAAVLLVLKRLEDAERDGDRVIAVIGDASSASLAVGNTPDAVSLTERFGHAHAASGLLHIAAAALACERRVRPNKEQSSPWFPVDGARVARVDVDALGEQNASVGLWSYPRAEASALTPINPSRVYLFGGASAEELSSNLATNTLASVPGTFRLAIVCEASDFEARRDAAIAALAARGDGATTSSVEEIAPDCYLGVGALEGETSFVFTGPAGAYPKMGHELLRAHPGLLDEVAAHFGNIEQAVGWLYEPSATRDRPPVDKLWGSSFLCQLHARLTRGVLGLKPEAVIGFCSGETNAMFAMGAWRGLEQMHDDIEREGVFDRQLGGDLEVLKAGGENQSGAPIRWETYRVLADEETVRAAVDAVDRVYLTIINSPGDMVIAGEYEACQRAIESIGKHRARSLGYNIVMHCPEARGFEREWRALHHRPTQPVPGVRFYTHATLSSYEVDADSIADALTGQAMDTVDFPALINKAWEDGVRVFIEHGPQAGCSQWIDRILGDRPHLAVSLDEYRRTETEQINRTIAKLAAAGVQGDWSKWAGAARQADLSPAARGGFRLAFPAHLPNVSLPARSSSQESAAYKNHSDTSTTPMSDSSRYADAQVMPPAPSLPSVLADRSALSAPTPAPQAQASAPPKPAHATPRQTPEPSPAPVAARPAPTWAHASPAAPVGATEESMITAAIASQFEQIGAMHQNFMAQQQQMQERFLRTRQAMTRSLLQHRDPTARGVAPAPSIAEVVPVTLFDQSHEKPSIGQVARSIPAAPVVPEPAARRPAPSAPSPPEAPAAKADAVSSTAPKRKLLNKVKKAAEAHTVKPKTEKPAPIGPTFDYDQIAIHASGKISDVFGPLFEQQDDFPIQVRMPEPPLLLCHRVTGIDCEPGVVGTGTLWCESDIPADSWFLHADRMPVGIMIESGQADLMLISWMGADFDNLGDRCYRLLGCELTFHGGLARPGDTLAYDIHIDGHAKQNDIRLFFFHYDCEVDGEVRLSVRHGQAGFFTYDELADSNGILWTPADEDAAAIAMTPFATPPALTHKRSFTSQEVQDFADGKVWETFGPGFERAGAHTATPTIQADRMRFMDEVLEFDPHGGPWNRGYLKARQQVSSDDWFFAGHFKNDPCMPGTLMFEGCVQTMAFYMAACGWTVDRDGWVFEPVPDLPYTLRCRGQVTPSSRELIYEVFVREIHDGDTPRLFADLLCTVDGLGAFHCARMGLQLVPEWPMDRLQDMSDWEEPKPVAVVDGFELGYDSLLACAWGRPTRAFGPMYEPFDSHRTVARLPGPPYHFISRVIDIDPDAQNAMKSDVHLLVEYDVPSDAWYFEENGARVMPYAVLLEAALQPCGWLASYVGCALTRDDIDLAFRNLDGTTNQFIEVTPETGTIQTSAHLKMIARAGGNIIVSFDVVMTAIDLDGAPKVLTMDTVFGFFPPDSLAAQVGLGAKAEFKEMFERPGDRVIDLATPNNHYNSGSLRLAEPMLLMIDRVTGWWPEAGEAGLGQVRAVKDVDPNEWFFKAHFFQDPVQPGSLGLEALLQLLQFAMIEKDLGKQVANPRFEAIAIDEPMTWKYRGQVVPTNKTISSTLEITRIGTDDRGVFAIANGSLWVDGMRIYHATNIGMRIVAGGEPSSKSSDSSSDYAAPDDEPEPRLSREFSLDPSVDSWLLDHCPTYTRPALPMMSIIDLLATQAAEARPGEHVVEVREVDLKKWVIFDGAERLRTRAEAVEGSPDTLRVSLDMWWEAPREAMSRFDEVATALVRVGEQFAPEVETLGPLTGALPCEDLYESAQLFHGPAFQVMSSVLRGNNGSSATLDAVRSGVPVGLLNPALLDGALQSIPHDRLELWWPEIPTEGIGYPHSVEQLLVHSPTPMTGELCAEVRFLGGEERLAGFAIQIFSDDQPWISFLLSEILMPKGPLGRLDAAPRRAFIRDGEYVEGASLSTSSGDESTLTMETVLLTDWFKGTLASVYALTATNPTEVLAELVAKEHVARAVKVHPSQVEIDLDLENKRAVARLRDLPITRYTLQIEVDSASARCKGQVTSELDFDHIKQWWQARLGMEAGWLGDDLYGSLLARFVSGVHYADPGALAALRGRSVLFLGNHEVQIESLLITILSSALTDTTTITMANAKHERGWVGRLIRDIFSRPGCADPRNIVYFNQSDRESMFTLLEELKQSVRERAASIMVHAPGTRAVVAGEPVERVSSLFLDMALELDLPIVPVYFEGGLSTTPLAEGKLEFPVDQTGQEYHFGRPILPEELAALDYASRRKRVLAGINELAPEAPSANPPRPEAVARIDAWRERTGKDEIDGTLHDLLDNLDEVGLDTAQILAHAAGKPHAEAISPERAAWIEAFAARFSS